jgi:DNA-binding Lrp family transcriptional regulator
MEAVVVRAYILIEMVAGHASRLVAAMKDNPAVKSIDRVTGPYDVIAVIEAANINDISDIVAGDIHTKQGVTRTLTCVALG